MVTHSCILAWRIPWIQKPGGLQSMGCKESDMTEWLTYIQWYKGQGDHLFHDSLKRFISQIVWGCWYFSYLADLAFFLVCDLFGLWINFKAMSINRKFGGSTVKNLPTCRNHRRCRFDPWVRNIPWSRIWQPTPVFFPGESHGQRSLAGYSPGGSQRVRHD